MWNGHGDATALYLIDPDDGSLTLANSYTYSTWGTPNTATHNGIGDLGFRFLYVGVYDVQWDNAYGLGLTYMHARHYVPLLGRFLQPDPARAEQNPYSYAGNSPVSKVDPTGLYGGIIIRIGRQLAELAQRFGGMLSRIQIWSVIRWNSASIISTANATAKNGFTVAGRSLQKHAKIEELRSRGRSLLVRLTTIEQRTSCCGQSCITASCVLWRRNQASSARSSFCTTVSVGAVRILDPVVGRPQFLGFWDLRP